MSKFKIGDKVRFVGDIKKHEQHDNDDVYIGDFIKEYPVMTIEFYKCEVYNVKENPFWSFDEDELELVETKYKVGDKVKVREDLVYGKDYGIEIFVDRMGKYKGKITEIENIFENGEYTLVDCDYWAFTDEMLEPVLDNPVDNPVDNNIVDNIVDNTVDNTVSYNVEKHKQICEHLTKLYENKNHDYGDSVHDTFMKYGLTSFLVRMEDKLNRARTLNNKQSKVNDEKITDTLMDLANYAIISLIELDKREE